MNIIQKAAEDYRKDSTYTQGVGSIELLKKVQDNRYNSIVTHFLNYLKQQGDEEIANNFVDLYYGNDMPFVECILKALAIGRATQDKWVRV